MKDQKSIFFKTYVIFGTCYDKIEVYLESQIERVSMRNRVKYFITNCNENNCEKIVCLRHGSEYHYNIEQKLFPKNANPPCHVEKTPNVAEFTG